MRKILPIASKSFPTGFSLFPVRYAVSLLTAAAAPITLACAAGLLRSSPPPTFEKMCASISILRVISPEPRTLSPSPSLLMMPQFDQAVDGERIAWQLFQILQVHDANTAS